MKINSFRIQVTPEQSAIVQEFMLKHDYCWRQDRKSYVQLVEYSCLIFDENENNGRISCFEHMYIYENLPIITFDWFINAYDLITTRKRKIEKLEKKIDSKK